MSAFVWRLVLVDCRSLYAADSLLRGLYSFGAAILRVLYLSINFF